MNGCVIVIVIVYEWVCGMKEHHSNYTTFSTDCDDDSQVFIGATGASVFPSFLYYSCSPCSSAGLICHHCSALGNDLNLPLPGYCSTTQLKPDSHSPDN